MIKEKVVLVRTYFKVQHISQHVANNLEFYIFLAILIPVPEYKQAALLVNKLVINDKLNLLIRELRDDIYQTNTSISKIKNDVEKIQSIATTVSSVLDLDNKINLIIEQTKQEFPFEFIIETENWSTQTVIDQIIYMEQNLGIP